MFDMRKRYRLEGLRGVRTRTALLTMAFAVLLLTTPAAADIDAKTFRTKKPVPEFSLSDHTGKGFNAERFKGQWSLVLLGYTFCPDVCPFTLQNIALVMEQLGFRVRPGGLPQVVFVGVDPDRDKEHIADYVKNFHDDFVGVTGDWKEVKRLVEGVDGFVRLEKRKPDDDAYTVRHNANVLVINPKGQIHASINPPFEPNQTADYLAKLFRDARRQSRLSR